jgi:hypothetical protein
VIYHFFRDAFSEVYTYRYRLTDPQEKLIISATWSPPPSGSQPEVVNFQDADERRKGVLQWEDRSWWLGDRFHLITSQRQRLALIEEHWNIVDRLLLHLPHYRLILADGNRLAMRGSRYGETFYEISVLPADAETASGAEGVWVGDVVHPDAGPTYVLETESPLLASTPLLVTAMLGVIDLWGLEKSKDAR